jgi:hypothetical protein
VGDEAEDLGLARRQPQQLPEPGRRLVGRVARRREIQPRALREPLDLLLERPRDQPRIRPLGTAGADRGGRHTGRLVPLAGVGQRLHEIDDQRHVPTVLTPVLAGDGDPGGGHLDRLALPPEHGEHVGEEDVGPSQVIRDALVLGEERIALGAADDRRRPRRREPLPAADDQQGLQLLAAQRPQLQPRRHAGEEALQTVQDTDDSTGRANALHVLGVAAQSGSSAPSPMPSNWRGRHPRSRGDEATSGRSPMS